MRSYVFVNRVYPPVGGATGELLRELAEGLASGGARVIVVTSRGPRRLRLPRRAVERGVEVIRVGGLPFMRSSHVLRALSYAGLYPRFMREVRRLGKVDVVISMTDPPQQFVAVTWASGRARRMIHWAQDVYPELAEELGVIKRGGFIAQSLRAISAGALRRQEDVVVVGRCMREKLIGLGVNVRAIEVIPNWTSVRRPEAREVAAMREHLGWGDKFIALYSGNLGMAHDFETVMEAAKILQGSGVQMVFAGEGPRLKEVRRRMSSVDGVTFLPSRPREELASFLASADVHLVTLRAELSGWAVPSKAYGIMAAGRPIVYVGPEDSEIARLVTESGAGIAVRNGDSRGMADVLGELKNDKNRLRMMEARCLGLADEFTFEKALLRWRSLLET